VFVKSPERERLLVGTFLSCCVYRVWTSMCVCVCVWVRGGQEIAQKLTSGGTTQTWAHTHTHTHSCRSVTC